MKQQRAATPKTATSKKASTPSLFGKVNYRLMIIGLVLLAVGFLLMAGGRPEDPNVFPADEIYSFRRITLAPLVIIAGFVIEIIAIFKEPKAEA